MPWSRKLECPDCGNVWTALLMKRTDASPPCQVCAAKPVEALAAPAIGRGAQETTSIKVPENKTKAIDLAMRIASDDNGGANFQTRSRPGEAVAIPVPEKSAGRWLDLPQATAMVAGDNTRGRNAGLLDTMADKRNPTMKPVYRTPKPA